MTVIGEKLTKSFAGVRVLDRVDIAVSDGEVHALLGANGSGKSTLVKILTGVYQPDDGAIVIDGRTIPAIPSPHDAADLGVAVVHQEAPLIDTLSVAECIAVFRGYPLTGIGRIRWRALEEETVELLRRFDVPVSPRALAGTLNPAERALVGLVIALDKVRTGVKLLVLDEVTASLPESSARQYLDRVIAIAQSGVAVLMVTHRLAELHGCARSITILREGRVVYSAPSEEIEDDVIVAQMVGRESETVSPSAPDLAGAVRRLWRSSAHAAQGAAGYSGSPLVVENLSAGVLRNVSFSLSAGVIVGVAGLAHSGVTELPSVLSAATQRSGGDIRVRGRPLALEAKPGEVIAAGMSVLPADRLRNGGIGTLSMAENVLLPQFDRLWGRSAHEAKLLDDVISTLDVRPPRANTLFAKLSGGNQQKALLGKWLLTKPAVLVLDDPTSGVDPGARETIFGVLRDASREGVAILLFSTEPEQLAAICSRVLILRGGRISTELAGDALSRQSISHWCYA